MRKTHPLRLRARRNCGYGADASEPRATAGMSFQVMSDYIVDKGFAGLLLDNGYWYNESGTVYHAKPEWDWEQKAVTGANRDAYIRDLFAETTYVMPRGSLNQQLKKMYPWYMLDASGNFSRRPISTLAKPGYYVPAGSVVDSSSTVFLVGNPKGTNKYLWDLARVEIVSPPGDRKVLEDADAKAFHDGGYKDYNYYTYEGGEALLAAVGASASSKPSTGAGGGGASSSSYVPSGGGGGGRTKPKRDDVVKPGTVTKPGPTKQLVKEASEARIKPGGGTNWFLPVGLGIAAIGTIVGAVYWRKRKA